MTYHCWACKHNAVSAPHLRCDDCERRHQSGHAQIPHNAPYQVAYRELVTKYGARLVAASMYAHDRSPNRQLSQINREHVDRMRELAGLPHQRFPAPERPRKYRRKQRDEDDDWAEAA